MLRTATSRFIAAHLALFSFSMALVLAVFTWQTTAVIEGESREVLAAEVEGLAEQYGAGGVYGLAQAITRRLARASERDAVYLLTDAYGQTLAGNLGDWPPTVSPGTGVVELELYRTDRDRPARVTAVALRLPDGAMLLVGRDSQARSRFEGALFRASLWAAVVALVLSLAGGWLMSRFVNRRIGEIRRTAGEIVAGDLARRIPLHGTDDEFDRLNGTLNAMLDRIAELVGSLRGVTDSLAHDLRSPLTRFRALLSDFAAPGLPEDERRRLAARAEAEADAMLRQISAMLEISRAEAGVGRDAFELADLARLLEDVGDLYAPAADDRGVEIALALGPAEIAGHPQLLAQALSNLLENALRYAPEGSVITLSSGAKPAPYLRVADAGPGIPEAERARALARFVTLDPSRSGGSTGLGLALVAAIAKLHGAELTLGDADPGLTVTLTFPLPERAG